MTEPRPRNRLARETSPYLLQHAGNPVDWHPWGSEALELARREDKPILLSIGYSACHWCHVMAHECFEDPDIAAVMNERFVNIKVDREERPDLDKIYQLSHQLLARQPGGWPLTLFLTPDQLPFFSGTYFPPAPRHGLPGFPELLERVSAAYREQGEAIAEQNRSLQEALARLAEPPRDQGMHADPLNAARQALAARYDGQFGGFGQAPKFPQPVALSVLLRSYARSLRTEAPDREALSMVCTTLRRMALGGIYDQVGGGFARYAVDRHWTIPHFEKMLYDNALLLGLYADAWHATGDELYRRIAEETGRWLCTHMQADAGGFYAALDADSEGEEGRYYVWDRDEVRELLTDEEWALVSQRFGLDGPPNFEGRWHFHVQASFSELAKALRRPRPQVLGIWESARRRLREHRMERVPPGRDEKVITSWNALAVGALARAGRLLGEGVFIDAAERALGFLHAHCRSPETGRLAATWKDGRAGATGFLDDHAFALEACLELLQARWSEAVLDFARSNADALLAHFEDPDKGGFYFTADDQQALIQRPRPLMDDALPSGNGTAALALNRLGHLWAEPRYSIAAERALDAAEGAVMSAPEAHGALLLAWDELRRGLELVIVRGERSAAIPLVRAAGRYFTPHRLIFQLPGDAAPPAATAGQTSASGALAAAWVCADQRCLPPVYDERSLMDRLGNPA